jgi:hypothetical protein
MHRSKQHRYSITARCCKNKAPRRRSSWRSLEVLTPQSRKAGTQPIVLAHILKARLYLTPRDYDQVTGKCPKWSGVGKPRLVGRREPRHGGTKAQRNFVKDAQRREHRAVRRDPRKPCRPQFVAQGRWRLEFDVIASWSSGQALGELAEL